MKRIVHGSRLKGVMDENTNKQIFTVLWVV